MTVVNSEGTLLVERLPCDNCGSSDALHLYTNGTWCFSCETYTHMPLSVAHEVANALEWQAGSGVVKQKGTSLNKDLTVGVAHRIKDRMLTADTCQKYGVTVGVADKKIIAYIHPYFDRDDQEKHVANKVRRLPKEFYAEGQLAAAGLFGQQAFPPGCAKAITLCEGELDAMSAYQMTGSEYPCVSIKTGAASAVKDVKRNREYLESFDKVYICFDADKQGRQAAQKVAKILSPGKAMIVSLDKEYKDANGYLMANKQVKYKKTWWKAQMYVPAGIIPSSTLKERIRNRKQVPSIPYPWEGLNKYTYGIRKGEAVIVTAKTGVGKTAFIREISHNILAVEPAAKLGTIYLEEIPEESGLGLMSVEASIPFHLPDAQYTEADYNSAEHILDDDRVFFYDSFGSTQIEEIVNRVRHYALALDCDYIFIDHLSIIVSDQMEGDERKLLDSIMTKLKTLTIELDIALLAVVHMNRKGEIRGTAGIEQMANTVIHLERDFINPDPEIRNTSNVVVTKNRFSGVTGPACSLLYDNATGRLDECEPMFEAMETEEKESDK